MVNEEFKGTSAYIRMDIVYAMNALLEDCTFDRLSVSAICNEVGISKSTFYRYFSSKYEVHQWIVEKFSRNGVQQIGRELSWNEGYLCTNAGLTKFMTLFAAAAESKMHDELFDFECANRIRHMTETVVRHKRVPLTERLDFQIRHFTPMEVSALSEWLSQRRPENVRDFSSLLTSLVPKELFELLDEPVQRKPLVVLSMDSELFTNPLDVAQTVLEG